MRICYIVIIGCLLWCSMNGCSHGNRERWSDSEAPAGIELHFSTSGVGVRTEDNVGLLSEEGKVVELLYAIFKGDDRVHYECKNLDSPLYLGDVYRIQNLNPDWFKDGDATVCVIANPIAVVKEYLENKEKRQDWMNCVYEQDLNKEIIADNNPSRSFETPMMAGYMKQVVVSSSAIVVQVEHVYSRLWYTFGWQGIQESDAIVIDSVRVSRLMNRTKVFNTSDEKIGYQLGNSPTMWGKALIKNGSREQPFIGNLTPASGMSYHLGDNLDMRIFYDTREEYNVVCRYPWMSGAINLKAKPFRYYTYSFQWNGTSLEDDPFLEVFYHFILQDGTEIHKRAFARLYDPNYWPGKRHHGIMRNYTYHVICYINTVSNKLDLQVTTHPWIETQVDDIPPFE